MSTILPHPYVFVTSMISQLAKIDSTRAGTIQSLSTLRRQDLKSAKPIFTTLHFLFPHELLPALDLLDRKLVTQLMITRSAESDQGTAVPPVPADSTTPAVATQQPSLEIFYVQSASATASSSKTNTRYRRVYNPTGTYYEVRLDAWNCTCPAFAYSAFGGALDLGHDQAGAEDGCDRMESEMNGNRPEWRFGGTITRDGTGVPICKHILAAMLGKALPDLFGYGVEQKEITAVEAAGWGGGWGD